MTVGVSQTCPYIIPVLFTLDGVTGTQRDAMATFLSPSMLYFPFAGFDIQQVLEPLAPILSKQLLWLRLPWTLNPSATSSEKDLWPRLDKPGNDYRYMYPNTKPGNDYWCLKDRSEEPRGKREGGERQTRSSSAAAARGPGPLAAGRLVGPAGGVLRPDLDPVGLVVDVEDALLDFVVDLPGRVDESLLDIGGRLGGGLHEDEAVLPGKGLALLALHVPPRLQITLVAYEHDDHVAVAVLPGVLQPGGEMVECVPPGDIVDEERPSSSTVVGPGDGPEGLLTSRIPDLQFDLLALDVDHAGPELHPDGEVVDRLEPLVCELKQQAGLAHASISDNDIFK